MRALRTASAATVLALLVVVLGVVVLGVAPAGALSLTPTDWRSTLVSVAPASDAVRVEVFEGGQAIRVVAAPGHVVTVPGYSNEPYLRITADGTVEENRNAATWWSNRSSSGDAPVPPDLPSTPDWVRIGSDGALTWHDHRIHAMPGVSNDTDWTVTFDVDGLPHTARGRLTELPSHTPAVEVLVALVVGGAVCAIGRRWARVVTDAAVLVATTIATVLAIGEAATTPSGMDVPVLHLMVAGVSMVLALGGITIARVRPRAGTVVMVAAIAAVSWWWALMVPALTAAIVPNSFADPIVRLGLAVVAGLVLAAATLLVVSGAFAEPIEPIDQSGDAVAA